MSLEWIDAELAQLTSSDLLRHRVARSGKLGATVLVDGKSYANFGSNDYLGIAGDTRLSDVVDRVVMECGWGSGASPLILGRNTLHAELEQQLAQFIGSEATLLFPTGFAANTGTIPALIGKRDAVFSDAKNHASIIDGCRLSGAKTFVYPHGDLDVLNSMIQSATGFEKRLIVSDGLFSMDGDLARVNELADIAEQHQAMLMIDEAHSFGVQGSSGAGICSEQGVADRVAIRVGTLSKSFGSHGGFVAGSARLIEYLSNRARSYVYSTAAPPAAAAVALAALRIIREEPDRRAQVLSNADQLRNALADQGWNVARVGTHIVPVIIGEPAETLRIAAELKRTGNWVPCIRPPSVPTGESLLRISLSASHTDEMLARLVDAFRSV